jgi:hypothetical protein
LNTETGAISPDRGNHAIRVTETGRTHPGIPRRVRYLVCTWLDGQCGHLLPHRWLQPGLCGPAGAAFRDELVTHAQGAVLRESIFAGAGRRSRGELVVLAHDAQGISAHACERVARAYAYALPACSLIAKVNGTVFPLRFAVQPLSVKKKSEPPNRGSTFSESQCGGARLSVAQWSWGVPMDASDH